MRVLSLFSGGGLGDYGLTLAGMEIVGQVEIDDYCQKILKLRWPDVPKWTDIKNVRGSEVIEKCGRIDLVSGGFPCQPFSVAGKKMGKDDARNMWPEMFRVIKEIKPHWVIAENVKGIIKPYLDKVLSDLESLGYACQPFVLSASAMGAPHDRQRLWIIANSNGCGLQVARTEQQADRLRQLVQTEWGKAWKTKPGMDRVVDGCSNLMDRLKLLGNGQVVQVVEWIGKRIMEFDKLG